jgi:predicted secreted protein
MGVQQNEIYLNAPTRITDNVKVVFGTREQPQVEIDDFEVLKEKEPNRYIRVMQFTAAAFETAVVCTSLLVFPSPLYPLSLSYPIYHTYK